MSMDLVRNMPVVSEIWFYTISTQFIDITVKVILDLFFLFFFFHFGICLLSMLSYLQLQLLNSVIFLVFNTLFKQSFQIFVAHTHISVFRTEFLFLDWCTKKRYSEYYFLIQIHLWFLYDAFAIYTNYKLNCATKHKNIKSANNTFLQISDSISVPYYNFLHFCESITSDK